MMQLKNWIGLCALLLSLQVYGNEISFQGAWIHPLTPGLEIAMVGMTIKSPIQARIISVSSPVYTYVTMQGPSKSGATKTQGLDFIALPAHKSVVLNADSMHLLLSGNKKTIDSDDTVQVIVTVQFDDNTRKTFTIIAQPEGSNNTSQSSLLAPPAAPRVPVEMPHKAEAKSVHKPVVVTKTPVAASLPVAVVAPKVATKSPSEVSPPEQPKPVDAQTSAECINLAKEIRKCDQSLNDMLLTWCETNAKSKSACQLSIEQAKKLKN